MKPLTTFLVAALVITIGAGIVFPPPQPPPPPLTPEPPSNAVTIKMASSITKTEWLDDSASTFNDLSLTDPAFQVDGKPVHVEILLEADPLSGRLRHWNSPTQVEATLNGEIEPTILSPASYTWIEKLNEAWRSRTGGDMSSREAPSLLTTPIVIAMWESRARALGCWPVSEADCTWERIRELAVDPSGWESVGHPEWRDFHFGYAYVGESDVGTQTAILLCMTGLGNTLDLEVDDVTSDNACGDAIADIEGSTTHRGTSSPLILAAMLSGGPSFLDAVTTYEKNVIGFNKSNPNSAWGKLVAIYPQDGTVVADHTFAIMDQAPWVTDDQVRAAEVFRDYLLTPERQGLLLESGLRPADPSLELAGLIDESFGASVTANVETVAVPDVAVLDQVITVWKELKKPANVALVFDKSGSMEGDKILEATRGAVSFVDEMDRNDWMAWLPFDSRLYSGPQGTKSEIGEQLQSDIRSTAAEGGTSLYDTVKRGYEILTGIRSEQGDNARYGIVVLSDGKDGNSDTTLPELIQLLEPTEVDQGIQVHIIGIGDDADDRVLEQIAGSTNGGRYWKVTDSKRIEAVYKRISKYW